LLLLKNKTLGFAGGVLMAVADFSGAQYLYGRVIEINSRRRNRPGRR